MGLCGSGESRGFLYSNTDGGNGTNVFDNTHPRYGSGYSIGYNDASNFIDDFNPISDADSDAHHIINIVGKKRVICAELVFAGDDLTGIVIVTDTGNVSTSCSVDEAIIIAQHYGVLTQPMEELLYGPRRCCCH
jgi:hypothetical protein